MLFQYHQLKSQISKENAFMRLHNSKVNISHTTFHHFDDIRNRLIDGFPHNSQALPNFKRVNYDFTLYTEPCSHDLDISLVLFFGPSTYLLMVTTMARRSI